jgi:hypothetical protein
MIEQIRHLQEQRSPEPFAIELVSGRVIQIYSPYCDATDENGHGTVGVLRGDGAFEVVPVAQIVSVSAGVRPVEQARMKKLHERFAPKP